MSDENKEILEEINQSIAPTFLVRTKKEGKDVWVFLSVPLDKVESFRDVHQSGKPYIMTDYGDVLHFGKGKDPPQAAWDYMEETHQEVVKDLQDIVNKSVDDAIEFTIQRLKEKGPSPPKK